jgi:D-alanine--poly(phosphoribitol) ligase subunit 1
MKYNFHKNSFEDQELFPDKIAIAGSDKDISWKELEQQCTQLHNIFNTLQIPKGHPIIIYGHKEAFFPAAMLACINADIPYIPIDKIYPIERVKKIAENTKAQILINCSEDTLAVEFAVLINASLEVMQNYAPDYQNKVYGNSSDPLRYIMFTSGSTGEPKGVLISKSSLLTFVTWAQKDFNFSEQDVFMNQAPFTFDVSLCDILNAFMRGSTLVLTSNEILKNQDAFIQRIKKYQCSVWTSTPSFAYLFLRHPHFNKAHLPQLKTFLFMGEPLPNRTCVSLKQAFNQVVVLLNAYGPTEATIVTTLIEITDEIIQKYPLLPIGKPMPASQLLVHKINEQEKEGEIVIVGNHVSDGYFKDEALSSKKFYIHNNTKAFKTGDLGYYQDDLLFCLGRNDDQVKMNGFRIELEEISQVILKNKKLADAICVGLSRNNEVKKIIAFIIIKQACNNQELIHEIKQNLQNNLPYYMMPGDVVIVDSFPVNVSHKVDKNKLIEQYLKVQLG